MLDVLFWGLKASSFCNLDVLYGGLGIGKLQFFIKKILNFCSAINFVKFLVIKTLDQPEKLDADPDQMNTDPKHW